MQEFEGRAIGVLDEMNGEAVSGRQLRAANTLANRLRYVLAHTMGARATPLSRQRVRKP